MMKIPTTMNITLVGSSQWHSNNADAQWNRAMDDAKMRNEKQRI